MKYDLPHILHSLLFCTSQPQTCVHVWRSSNEHLDEGLHIICDNVPPPQTRSRLGHFLPVHLSPPLLHFSTLFACPYTPKHVCTHTHTHTCVHSHSHSHSHAPYISISLLLMSCRFSEYSCGAPSEQLAPRAPCYSCHVHALAL